MAFTKFTKDIAYHIKMPDQPNDTGGLTAEDMKRLFDQAGLDIQEFINATLIEEIKQKVDEEKGAIASVNGVDNAAGNINIVGGTGITVVPDNTNKTITLHATGEALPAPHAHSHAKGGVDEITPESIGAVSEDEFNAHKADIMPHQSGLNVYVDTNSLDANGIYTVVNYKRADGTLYMKSTLSGGTSPNYTTDTWQFYDDTGTTVVLTKIWTLTYDADGKIISKVVA